MLDLLRRIGELPLVRRLVATRFGPLPSALWCSRVVARRWKFLRAELGFRRKLACHRLAGSQVRICIRHNTPDIWTLREVFVERQYDPPAVVGALLDRLEQPLTAADLGANVGLWGAQLVTRFPDARITAFEPDAGNARVHRRCIEANARGSTWRLIEACAATQDGELPFRAGDFATSRVEPADAPGTRLVPALDVFNHLDGVDLLKLDIEGGEWPILGDPRFAEVGVPAIVLEYHPHMCPSATPCETALGILEAAGYTAEATLTRLPGHGVIWAWRPAG